MFTIWHKSNIKKRINHCNAMVRNNKSSLCDKCKVLTPLYLTQHKLISLVSMHNASLEVSTKWPIIN